MHGKIHCGRCHRTLHVPGLPKCTGECQKTFHFECSGILEVNYRKLTINGVKWICKDCLRKRTRSQSASDDGENCAKIPASTFGKEAKSGTSTTLSRSHTSPGPLEHKDTSSLWRRFSSFRSVKGQEKPPMAPLKGQNDTSTVDSFQVDVKTLLLNISSKVDKISHVENQLQNLTEAFLVLATKYDRLLEENKVLKERLVNTTKEL